MTAAMMTRAMDEPGPVLLTDREVEVLRAWLCTESKASAARELYIAECTVAEHVARVRAKYVAAGRHATTKTALAARLLQDGHVRLDELR